MGVRSTIGANGEVVYEFADDVDDPRDVRVSAPAASMRALLGEVCVRGRARARGCLSSFFLCWGRGRRNETCNKIE